MPLKLTESQEFEKAAAEGRKKALDDAGNAILKNREDRNSTALPSASSASTKEAIDPGDNGSASVSDKTPAPGRYFSPSAEQRTVFRGSFFDRQDNLESRLNAQQYDIQQMKEMLSMVLDRLPSPPAAPMVPAKLLFLLSPIGTESEKDSGTDDDDSQVFEESRSKRTSISNEKEPESKETKPEKKEEPNQKMSEPDKTPESPKTGRKIRDLKEMLRLVPTYEGKGSGSLLQYINMFEIYLKNAVKCSDYDAEVTFFLATGRLKGDAWAEWRANGTDITEWKELKSFLTKRFITRQNILDLSSTIHTSSQGKHSIKEYVEWFQKTALQLTTIKEVGTDFLLSEYFSEASQMTVSSRFSKARFRRIVK